MFLFAFGAAWLEYYAFRVVGVRPLIFLILLLIAYRRYKHHKPALSAEASSLQQKRMKQIFHLVNAAQWVAIIVVGNLLIHLGLSAWRIPAIIFIVGLHFLPLASIFAYPPHYISGAGLIALSTLYPLLAPDGPSSPIGCLVAGLILWASAFWALRRAFLERLNKDWGPGHVFSRKTYGLKATGDIADCTAFRYDSRLAKSRAWQCMT